MVPAPTRVLCPSRVAGRNRGPPLLRRHRAPARVDARRGGAGRRPAAVSDKMLERVRVIRLQPGQAARLRAGGDRADRHARRLPAGLRGDAGEHRRCDHAGGVPGEDRAAIRPPRAGKAAEPTDPDAGFVGAVAAAYEAGPPISFAGLFAGETRRHVSLRPRSPMSSCRATNWRSATSTGRCRIASTADGPGEPRGRDGRAASSGRAFAAGGVRRSRSLARLGPGTGACAYREAGGVLDSRDPRLLRRRPAAAVRDDPPPGRLP